MIDLIDHNGSMDSQLMPPEADIPTVVAAHAGGAQILDVRQPHEYGEAHVSGAVLIPLGELAQRQAEIPQADPLYVMCAVGGRSLSATAALVDAGYPAVSVSGGINAWIAAGHPVVTGESPT